MKSLISGVLGCVTLFGALSVQAGAVITYHGRILTPTGQPLETANVSFNIRILSPSTQGSCVLYEEQRTLNMTGSNGTFVIPIGDGEGARTSNDPNFQIEKVFSNSAGTVFNKPGAWPAEKYFCNSGSSYTPAPLDGRQLVVSFKDGSGNWQILPNTDVTFIPFAVNAYDSQKLAGQEADSYLRVQGASATPLSPADFLELQKLIDGTSASFGGGGGGGGGGGSGTVTSVIAGTGLSGGTISVSGTIGIADGGVGSTQLADNAVATAKIQDAAVTDAKIAGLAWSKLTGIPADISSAGTDIDALQTSVTNINTALGGKITAPASCGAGQVLSFISVSDWTCIAVTSSQWVNGAANAIYYNAGYVGLGTATPDRRLTIVGDGTNYSDDIMLEAANSDAAGAYAQVNLAKSRGTTAARSSVLAGDTLGALAFRGYLAGDFEYGAKILSKAETNFADNVDGDLRFQTTYHGTSADRMLITSEGKVGIGAPIPQAALHVNGSGVFGTSIPADVPQQSLYTGKIFVGMDNGSAGIHMRRHENVASGPYLEFSKSMGTMASPSPVVSGTRLGDIRFGGWMTAGTTESSIKKDSATMLAYATENWSSTATGSELRFSTTKNGTVAAVNRLAISHDGKIGMGINSPESNLHVASINQAAVPLALGSEASITIESNGVGPGYEGFIGSLWFGSRENTTEGTTKAAGVVAYMDEDVTTTSSPASLFFYTTPTGSTTAQPRMVVDKSGKVGIGITSPQSNLHVSSGIAISHASDTSWGPQFNLIKFRGDYSSAQPVQANDQLGAIAAGGSYNTAGGFTDEASSILFVAAENFEANKYGSHILFRTTATGSNSALNRMVISSEGDVGIGTGLNPLDARFVVYNGSTIGRYETGGWTSTSDGRLKENVQTLEGSLDKILQLRGVSYSFRKDETHQQQLGFIAQEVEPIFPEVVRTDQKGYKSMIYANLVAPVVEAIKEIFAKTEKQEREIASLKEENAQLKAWACGKDPEAPFCTEGNGPSK